MSSEATTDRGHRGRFFEGVLVSYGGQGLALVVGLIQTKIVLNRIDPKAFGVWLTALQIVSYTNLLDFGVLALLPRDMAALREVEPASERITKMSACLSTATRAVLLQTGGAVLITILGVLILSLFGRAPSAELTSFVLGVILLRPNRLLYGALEGLQQFGAIGRAVMLGQVITAVVTAAMVLNGWDLAGVVIGWMTGQLYVSGAWLYTLKSTEGALVPVLFDAWKSGPWRVPVKTGWLLSLQQLAQILISSSDVILVNWLLGPAVVTSYVCTTKAITILSNIPATIMMVSLPVLAAMRTSRSREEIQRVIRVIALGMLTLSGFFVVGIFGLNETFVTYWVGSKFYLGNLLTGLAMAAFFLRHATLVQFTASFAWGEEIALARGSIVEAFVFVTLCAAGIWMFGIYGVPVASFLGIGLVTFPVSGRAVSRALPGGWLELVKILIRFAAFVLSAVGILVASQILFSRENLPGRLAIAFFVLVLYSVVVTWQLRQEKVGEYLPAFWRKKLGWVLGLQPEIA